MRRGVLRQVGGSAIRCGHFEPPATCAASPLPPPQVVLIREIKSLLCPENSENITAIHAYTSYVLPSEGISFPETHCGRLSSALLSPHYRQNKENPTKTKKIPPKSQTKKPNLQGFFAAGLCSLFFMPTW